MHPYERHIATEHLTHKQQTLHKVKSLDPVDMQPLNGTMRIYTNNVSKTIIRT